MDLITVQQAYKEALSDMGARLRGEAKSYSTGWATLDPLWFKGVEAGDIVTLAGTSGTGKTAFIGQMLRQMCSIHKGDVAVLFFTFEMAAKRLVTRMIANEKKFTLKQLLQASEAGNISEYEYKQLLNERPAFSRANLFFDQTVSSAEGMRAKIREFRKYIKNVPGISSDALVLVVLDHLLLAAKGTMSMTDQNLLESVMAMQNEEKKVGNIAFIDLSQLNREFDSAERVEKVTRQYPIKSDIFGSDKVYHYSDVVAILDNPHERGIVNIYGHKKLPVGRTIPNTDVVVPYVFLHNLKVRDGRPKTIAMWEFDGRYYQFNEIIKPASIENTGPVFDVPPQLTDSWVNIDSIRPTDEEINFLN
jgi:replicative DNA helicase